MGNQLSKPPGNINPNDPPGLVGLSRRDFMEEADWEKELLEAVSHGTGITTLLKLRQKRIRETANVQGDSNRNYGDEGLHCAVLAAIDKNHSALALQLIEEPGIKLGHQEKVSRRTILHRAVSRGRKNIVEDILGCAETAQYVDLGDSKGRAALHEAAARGDHELVHILVTPGANIDVPDNRCMTPLHLVIWHRREKLAKGEDKKQLLRIARQLIHVHGAKVNTKDNFGKK
jgi:ankyrin repeat protein